MGRRGEGRGEAVEGGTREGRHEGKADGGVTGGGARGKHWGKLEMMKTQGEERVSYRYWGLEGAVAEGGYLVGGGSPQARGCMGHELMAGRGPLQNHWDPSQPGGAGRWKRSLQAPGEGWRRQGEAGEP